MTMARKSRQKIMLLSYNQLTIGSWSSGQYTATINYNKLPLDVVLLKSHVILDYETQFDSIGHIEGQVSINLDSNAQVSDGILASNLISLASTDVVQVHWLPDSYDIHLFPTMAVGTTHYSSHITDIFLNMAKNDIDISIHLRDGFGGVTNPTTSGQLNAWIVMECEVL